MDRLKNKVALNTGGGSGIGAATSHLFARKGAKVMITGNKEEEIKRVAGKFEQTGGAVSYAVHNISKKEEWKTVKEKTISAFGKIDILVNNAGISGNLFIPLEERTQEEFALVLSVNLTGTFLDIKNGSSAPESGGLHCKHLLHRWHHRQFGGFAYTASKGGQRLLSKGAVIEPAEKGIRVNSVHPGYVDTPMVRDLKEAQAFKAESIASTPMKRGAAPKEIAQGILFLASDEASFVTGAELIMDGGFTAY